MTMLPLSRFSAVAISTALAVVCFASQAAALETCCGPEEGPSWIFATGTYTNDPFTGARVAQYERKPPVEPLEDERNVTSSYRRTRTELRGADGSTDTYYQVQAWGNGRGGIDAEWERFHDAWKEAYLTGGSYYYTQAPYGYGPGYGYGPSYGYGNGGYGNSGYGPGYGGPAWNNGNGNGNWNGPQGNWGGPGNGNHGWNGPPQGGQGDSGQQGNWHHNGHNQEND